MRILESGEVKHRCFRCNSLIAMFPHEIHEIGPPGGPYDMDYEPEEVGRKYWSCPACKAHNWLGGSKSKDDYDDY